VIQFIEGHSEFGGDAFQFIQRQIEFIGRVFQFIESLKEFRGGAFQFIEGHSEFRETFLNFGEVLARLLSFRSSILPLESRVSPGWLRARAGRVLEVQARIAEVGAGRREAS
jgi:hypothetical protein